MMMGWRVVLLAVVLLAVVLATVSLVPTVPPNPAQFKRTKNQTKTIKLQVLAFESTAALNCNYNSDRQPKASPH